MFLFYSSFINYFITAKKSATPKQNIFCMYLIEPQLTKDEKAYDWQFWTEVDLKRNEKLTMGTDYDNCQSI